MSSAEIWAAIDRGDLAEVMRLADPRIITEYVYPPIPMRNFDWAAYREGYDCDCDGDGYFSKDPVGHGPTEQAAIADLLTIEDERDD